MHRILGVFIFSLWLLHEMDAIRTKEWKMFIRLRDMPDETAYKIFSAAHLPLYVAAVMVLTQGTIPALILFCILDCFLIAHTLLHLCFSKKANNGFTAAWSKLLIYGMGILAVVHLLLMITA